MQNISQTLTRYEHLWRKQNVVAWAFGWAALSLLFYMFLSGSPQNTDRPFWYRIFTAYILQNVPTICAGLLCIRNGTSSRMPSGSKVWLLMGIALLAYFVGNIFFSSWELVWHLNSTGSLGDPFFVIFYICLLLAMFIAIASKRVKLKLYQWRSSPELAFMLLVSPCGFSNQQPITQPQHPFPPIPAAKFGRQRRMQLRLLPHLIFHHQPANLQQLRRDG